MELIITFIIDIIDVFFSVFTEPGIDKSGKKKLAAIIIIVLTIVMLIMMTLGIFFRFSADSINEAQQKTGSILMIIGGSYLGVLIVAKIVSVIIKKSKKQL